MVEVQLYALLLLPPQIHLKMSLNQFTSEIYIFFPSSLCSVKNLNKISSH